MEEEKYIEFEKLYEEGKELEIVSPFDPKRVEIESKPMILYNIVERLKDGGIDYVGAGTNLKDASNTLFKTVKGKTFAFINCCEHEFSIASDETAGSNPLNPIQQYYKIQEAKANAAEATVYCEQMEAGAEQCIAIRRRTDMFYSLLSILDSRFLPLIHKMQEVVANEGYDYSKYSINSKKVISTAASMAVSVKAVLDTPLLTDDGSLTDASEELYKKQMPAISHSAGHRRLPENNQ